MRGQRCSQLCNYTGYPVFSCLDHLSAPICLTHPFLRDEAFYSVRLSTVFHLFQNNSLPAVQGRYETQRFEHDDIFTCEHHHTFALSDLVLPQILRESALIESLYCRKTKTFAFAPARSQHCGSSLKPTCSPRLRIPSLLGVRRSCAM